MNHLLDQFPFLRSKILRLPGDHLQYVGASVVPRVKLIDGTPGERRGWVDHYGHQLGIRPLWHLGRALSRLANLPASSRLSLSELETNDACQIHAGQQADGSQVTDPERDALRGTGVEARSL